jgi:hypothetical protein
MSDYESTVRCTNPNPKTNTAYNQMVLSVPHLLLLALAVRAVHPRVRSVGGGLDVRGGATRAGGTAAGVGADERDVEEPQAERFDGALLGGGREHGGVEGGVVTLLSKS